jgi:hypothetical protein
VVALLVPPQTGRRTIRCHQSLRVEDRQPTSASALSPRC